MYRVNVGAQRGIGNVQIKSTPLMVNGILYFTVPDHVYAIDARTGEELWHYDWVDKGGHLVGNRGVGMYGNWLYFMAPDGWFISLNAQNGKERWSMKVADEKLQYFTTMAPMIVEQSRHCGRGRRRDGRARVPGSARSGNRRIAVALEFCAARGRARRGDLAQ